MSAPPSTLDAPSQSQVFDPEAEVTGYERSPLDVLRVVLLAASALVVVLLIRYFRSGYEGIEDELTQVMEVPWAWLLVTVEVLLLIGVLVATLVVLVVPLVTRRFRLFGYVLAANVVASLAVSGIDTWVGGLATPETSTDPSLQDSAHAVGGDVVGMTQMVASFVVVSPFVGQRWRRAGVWLVATVMVLRLVVADGGSTHALLVLTLGAAIGSAVLLAFGRPQTQPRPGAILASLRSSGLPVVSIEPASVDARGSVPYFAALEGGDRVFVKVLGTDQRAADLLFRLYRMLHLKNVGDERPFSSLRRTVEHEALVALQARDIGVRTPRLRCVAPVGADSFLLSYDMIDGSSLDGVGADRLTESVLVGIWEQVDLLRRHRIAHRDLRLANVFLGADEAPWMIDFGFSELAASDVLLRSDVAQLLASLALAVGPEAAVGPAVRVLGPDAVAASLGRIQPAALSGATQNELKAHKGLLEELRGAIEAHTDAEEPELEPVTRFSSRQLLTLAMIFAVIYFLVPQFADLPKIAARVGEADWVWAVPLLLASGLTYFGAALALLGSVPSRVPYLPATAAQVASSFASKLAPARLGGMALNVRFLQRSGVDATIATSSVGLNAVAGVIGHIALIGVFMLWAGRSAFGGISLPSPRAFLIGVAVVAVFGAMAMAVPTTRKLVVTKLVPILKTSLGGLRQVLTSPGKLALLFGGSTLVTFSYIAAFYLAGQAFDLDVRFATLGAVYLLGSTVAMAAPTPGGLGATEAILLGGLVAVGAADSAAVPTVFLFRLATFWVPIIPGWIAFTWLRRTERL